jgi:hypothetical protein
MLRVYKDRSSKISRWKLLDEPVESIVKKCLHTGNAICDTEESFQNTWKAIYTNGLNNATFSSTGPRWR